MPNIRILKCKVTLEEGVSKKGDPFYMLKVAGQALDANAMISETAYEMLSQFYPSGEIFVDEDFVELAPK